MSKIIQDFRKAITPGTARIVSVLLHPAILQILLLFLTAKWYEESFPRTTALVLGILVPFGLYFGITRLFYPEENAFASRNAELKILLLILNIFCLFALKFFIPEASVRVWKVLDALILLQGSLLFITFFYNISLHAVGIGFFVYTLVLDMLILENKVILFSYETSVLGIFFFFLTFASFLITFLVLFSRYRLGAHTVSELISGFVWGIFFMPVLLFLGI